jgi:leucyl-tRNA synthetase
MMRAKLHSAIKNVTGTLDGFRFNITAGSLMKLANDIQSYADDAHKETLKDSLEALIAMLSPFAPHICEEAWELWGGKGFVSLAQWPKHDEKLIDSRLEMMEELVESTKSDIREVIKIVGKEPKSISIYVSALWKYTVYNEILEAAKGEAGLKDLMKRVMALPQARQQGKHAASFAERLMRDARTLGGVLPQEDEFRALTEAVPGMEKLFNCKVKVIRAESAENREPSSRNSQAEPAKSQKALRAEPGKPGIEVEC